GQEYDCIFLDEATQFTEMQFATLTACLRGVGDFPRRMYLTCNPGGVGHDWVKRLFVDRRYRPAERPEDYVFIPARVYDNAVLMRQDSGYVQMLESLPEDLRRAWLEGDWNVFAGQFFREFNRDTHVCRPFEIPPHWRIYVTMDYGLDMLACLWVAVDERGRAVVFRELYESDLIISEAAERILAATKEAVDLWLAPPDLWNRRQESGRSVADLFAERGISLTKTSNDRVAGWMAVKEWLHEGAEGEPRLRMFEGCHNLIRTLPMLRYDEQRPSDAATTPHELTHAPDALRGFCVYWTQAAEPPRAARSNWSEDLWEDYNNAGEAGKAYLVEKYGSPFSRP
ncbi:MAG: phage terminase large subunit, partial [Clostridia bacterium]|nr:phage terminase large subunit [Clostridia bacterium]